MIYYSRYCIIIYLIGIAYNIQAMKWIDKQKELIGIYNQIIKAQQAAPERGYDSRGSSDMYSLLLDSLKDAQKLGLTAIYRKMLFQKPDVFARIFSSHNIQMLAYQQNIFGNGDPYVFKGELGFSNKAEEPSLIEYIRPNGERIVLSRYAYFFGMLGSIDAAANEAGKIKRMSDNEEPLNNLNKNIATLKANLQEAKRNAEILSKEQVAEIASRLIAKGNKEFINLINNALGVNYAYKQ